MSIQSSPRELGRLGSILLVLASLAGMEAGLRADQATAAPRPPATCDDPMTLRLLASGLHFRGAPPEGFRPTEHGLRNPETGEEIPVRVDTTGATTATVRIRDARIELRRLRTTGETPNGWRCAAEFTMERADRVVRGETTYTSEIDGLNYRVGGRISIEGVEISF